MASLSGGTYISVGILVTAVSLIMVQMRPFIIVGVVFLVIGFIKLLLARRTTTQMKTQSTYHTTSPKTEQSLTPGTKMCYVCSAKNNSKANFCGHCGHRLS